MIRLPIVVVLVAGACQADLDAPREPASLDRAYFDCRVQPVLTKNCAQLACHGAPDPRARYFRIYGRNRLRIDPNEAGRDAVLSLDERAHNYDAARALVDPLDPGASLLLKKPLEASTGGFFHRGATLFGAVNVFATPDDPEYQTIADWVGGATEEPTCQEPGANL